MTDAHEYLETPPVIGIGEALLVTITAPDAPTDQQTPSGYPRAYIHPAANALANDFVQWQYDNDVWPFEGTTSATNFYAAAFPLGHAHAIREFLSGKTTDPDDLTQNKSLVEEASEQTLDAMFAEGDVAGSLTRIAKHASLGAAQEVVTQVRALHRSITEEVDLDHAETDGDAAYYDGVTYVLDALARLIDKGTDSE